MSGYTWVWWHIGIQGAHDLMASASESHPHLLRPTFISIWKGCLKTISTHHRYLIIPGMHRTWSNLVFSVVFWPIIWSVPAIYRISLSAATSGDAPSETGWWYVHCKALIPKMYSLIWTIHARERKLNKRDGWSANCARCLIAPYLGCT
jgi:hypothetical protein